MEDINPKESNQKRQTRTQPHRDPNEQSDDMNPKKKKKVLSLPKTTGISQKEQSGNGPTRSRQDEVKEEKAWRALFKSHARTHFKPSFQEQRRRGEK
jgi:hypothetical protein